MPHKFEIRVRKQMLDIRLSSGEEIIETDNLCAVRDQPFAKMRADKTRTACNKNSHKLN